VPGMQTVIHPRGGSVPARGSSLHARRRREQAGVELCSNLCSPCLCLSVNICLQGECEFNALLKNLVPDRCKYLQIEIIMSIINVAVFRHL